MRDKHKAMAKWSTWWHASNKWLFFIQLQWLKTRKRKSKTTLVSFIYREKKKKKKKLFHIHDWNHWFSKMEEEKKYIYIYYCESISFKDSPAHISTRAPSVWYVPLPYDRATWSPKTQHPPPDPSHNTEIHGPQRQDVQKLVFNIKQCRPYRKQLSPHPPTPFLLLLCKVWAYMKDGQSPPLQNDRKTKRRAQEEAENIRTEHRSSLCIIHTFSFSFFFFKHTHSRKIQPVNQTNS